jgi:hypothetical protein
MIRSSGRTPDQARKIALRRARIFASHGRSHLAEMEINELLRAGVPANEVSEALEHLPDDSSPLVTRREALQRTSALLAGGVLMSSGALAARPSVAVAVAAAADAAADAGALAGLFVMTPLMNGQDGSFSISRITSAGLRRVPGTYRGYAFAASGSAYIVFQSWDTGSPVTITDVISADGSTKRLTTAPGRNSGANRHGAATIGSRTTACKRGSYLYVASTWIRTYREAGAVKPQPGNHQTQGRGNYQIRVTTQQSLQVIDSASGSLAASWTGPEGAGGCMAGLKVSDDGRGIVLSADSPDQQPPAAIRRWQFDGAALKPAPAAVASPELVYALANLTYHWPAWNATLTQVGGRTVHSYSAPGGIDHVTGLSLGEETGNAHAYQAVADSSGLLVVSSGYGQFATWRPGPATLQIRTLPANGQDSARAAAPGSPAFGVYSGTELRTIAVAAGPVVWLIDNREGVGGMWRLNPQTGSAVQELRGTYLADCAADESGTYVAAISPIESAAYLIGPSGDTRAFKVRSHTHLISRS